MKAQKTNVPARAGGAVGAGLATEQAPVKESYTIVVYEKSVKKVVLYVGRKTYTFNVPADVNIGNVAVIIKKWLAGGKTPAYSASIHVENLAELLRTYAPDVAEQLAHILNVAVVIAYADGAQPEAVQLAPADTSIVCSKVNDLISDMRSDVILAVRIDEFLEILNSGLQIIAEERGDEPVQATAEDVKKCIMYDESVEIVRVDNYEVLWLWGGPAYMLLMNKVAEMAAKYRMILADPEKYNDEQIYSEE